MIRLPSLLLLAASASLLLCLSFPSASALELSTLELGSSFRQVGVEGPDVEPELEPTLPVNSPCAARCASDSACPAACDAQCRGNFECLLDCRARCVTAVTACVEQCAWDFAKAQATDTMWKLEEPQATRTAGSRAAPRAPELNTGFGPETVLNWAGYVSVNGSSPTTKRHLWYWAFESRNDPANDPLVLWMTVRRVGREGERERERRENDQHRSVVVQ